MSTLTHTNPTLLDLAKSTDPSGKAARIVEILNQKNEILDDMSFIEGNLPTGHQTTIRTGLPGVYWRLMNKGTPESTTSEAQATESCGMLHSRSAADKALAHMAKSVESFRLSRAKGHFEAMMQEMAQTYFYGNAGVSPEEFTGLSARYSDTTAENGQNILLGGGVGADNTSIWLIVWGEDTVTGIFPQNSKAGLEHEDLGLGDAFDADGNRFRAYLDEWVWKAGLLVADWRYAVRICNLDVSALKAKSSAADLFDFMIKATHRIPDFAAGRAAFYMNRDVFESLDIQQRDDVSSGGGLKFENVDGKQKHSFRGIPVRRCDQILSTESLVA